MTAARSAAFLFLFALCSTSSAQDFDLASSTDASASAPVAVPGGLRSQDEFWVVDTGNINGCLDVTTQTTGLVFRRYDAQSRWKNASLEDFVATSAKSATVFYVPGNRVAGEEAVRRGWNLYHMLRRASDEEPLRLIVWSWPSGRVHGAIGARDFEVKAARTFTESAHLGWLLNQIDPAAKVSLVGFSYGSRIITGALHVSAGGSVSGHSTSGHVAQAVPRKTRVVLMAAATHNYWLFPGQFHGNAISQVDRMLILYNSSDRALKHYHLTEPDGDPRALGYTGLATHRMGADAQRIAQRDVCGEIGKTHDELKHYCSSTIVDELQRYLLWGPTN